MRKYKTVTYTLIKGNGLGIELQGFVVDISILVRFFKTPVFEMRFCYGLNSRAPGAQIGGFRSRLA